MKELGLHVGHTKTGTSYLQSIFSLNVTLLQNLRIEYPNHTSFKRATKRANNKWKLISTR